MSETEDAGSLLTVALQDLYAGEKMAAARVAALADHAEHPPLAAALKRVADRASHQAEVLAETGRATGGPDNLWMRGILDDAERDTATVASGPLLDAALIGAIRKMLASKRASYETALALAERLNEPSLAAMVRRCCNEEAASDDCLAVLLTDRTEHAA